MVVPQELLDRWKALRSVGDPKDISDTMDDSVKVKPETIRRVFVDGKCNDEVFKAMADFYIKRAEFIAQYLSPAR